ncbi:hypothetical protein [Streptomyces sp. NPDC050264]|uniref:hypothetical protein n=1 Tax=Streptomyces sp. NPDC050264 TaxID=3155038 RepID=UPI00341BE355
MTDPLHDPVALGALDELGLLRAADPVPADDPRYADGPLHHRAERSLNQLLHGSRARRARRILVLRAEAAVCALAALLVLGLSYAAAPAATAAPAPLDPGSVSSAVPLDEVAARAERAAADGRPRLRQGAHVSAWTLGAHRNGPEERVVPREPGRPRPPHDTAGLRRYLAARHHGDIRKASQLLLATRELLDHWTLGARETAALARLLADTEGLRPAGPVTDRLGRPGQAYAAAGAMLILDPADGTVLGMEITSPGAGKVLSYSAWRR